MCLKSSIEELSKTIMEKYKEPKKGLQCKDCVYWMGDESISMGECQIKDNRGDEHDYITNSCDECDEWENYLEEKKDLGREKYE